MNPIVIEGWGVARADAPRRVSPTGPPDHLQLFRGPDGWTLLTLACTERVGEDGNPVAGRARVSSATFASTGTLADAVRARYGEAGWWELLEAGHERDPELRVAWAPLRIERDLDEASLHRGDLARFTGLLGGHPAPAPGRRLPGWRLDALEHMATHLEERGFEVRERLGIVEPAGGEDNRMLGVLSLRRYGFATTAVVQVDDVGEVYVRLVP